MFLVCDALTCMMCICTQSVKKCPIKEIPDRFKKTTDSDSFQHKIIPYNKPQNNVFVCKQHAFICHQQHCVAGGGDGGVVVALVEGAGLVGGGFGGEGGDERQTVGGEQLVQTRKKLRVCLRKLPAQVFKVHVQPHIALFPHRLKHRPGERLLERFTAQHDHRLRGGKGPGGRQRRQVQKRPHTIVFRQSEQPLVVHRHERALRRKAVGKRHQRPGKRQNAAQDGFLHIRIRIAAGEHAARPALLKLRYKNLVRIEPVGAGEIRVHPVQRQNVRPGRSGNG